MAKHWHVHSHMGGGYLCECDRHYPLLTAHDRDEALRRERDDWHDYAIDSPTRIRISGSVRASHFTITDLDSIAWERSVDAWQCSEAECLKEED